MTEDELRDIRSVDNQRKIGDAVVLLLPPLPYLPPNAAISQLIDKVSRT